MTSSKKIPASADGAFLVSIISYLRYIPNDMPPHIPYTKSKVNETPGPVYFKNSDLGIAAVGRQLSSTKKNAPKFRFSKSIREKESKIHTLRSGVARTISPPVY